MPDVVIIAVAAAVKAVADMVTKAMDGQPPDVKAKLWTWYVEDVAAWRKFWGLDK